MKFSAILMSYIKLFESSTHAAQYAKYRPTPPPKLIERIVDYLNEKLPLPRTTAVDVGCGTGQSTTILAPHFDQVVGIDVSRAQIEEAQKQEKCANVVYKCGSSDKIPSSDSSVQLITVSQALHWFDLGTFYKEVNRVLVPGGVLAAYCYDFPIPSGFPQASAMKKELDRFYEVETKPFWHENRKIVDDHYKDIEMPYPESIREQIFKDEENWSINTYLGYVQSWSGYQKLLESDRPKGEQLLVDFQKRLLDTLDSSTPDTKFGITWQYTLLMSRKPL